MQGVQETLQAAGYQILIGGATADLEEERSVVEQMLALNVDGIIINPSDSFDLLWKSMKPKLPLVAYNPAHSSRYPVWVGSNDYEAACTALEAAADCGYRRFVLITQEKSRHSGIAQRILAFEHLTRYRHLPQKTIVAASPEKTADLEFGLVSEIRVTFPPAFT